MPRNTNTNGHEPAFPGFSSPNYTQVPDELFDQLMPLLTDCELRVLLYIIRRTFGFKRESDNISLSQLVSGITTTDGRVLDRGTGLSKATVARALAGLKEKGIIVSIRNRSSERGNEASTYRLRFQGEEGHPLVSPVRQAPLSQQRDNPLSQQRDKQYTGIQKTDNISSIRKEHAKKYGENTRRSSIIADASVTDQSHSDQIKRVGDRGTSPQASQIRSDASESTTQLPQEQITRKRAS